MKSLKVRFVGVRPLLMHNGQLADPLNYYAKLSKEVSGKKKKTDSDFEKLSKIAWKGGLYLNKDEKIIMPSLVIEAAIKSQAKTQKKGKEVDRGISVLEDVLMDLGKVDNKKSLDDMMNDEEHTLRTQVVVGRARIMRTRPKFDTWSFECEIRYEEGILNEAEILSFIENIYFCDWRPRYGLAHGKIIK